MSKAMIVHEIQVLEARLHQAMRLDRWDLWTWENEQSLGLNFQAVEIQL